MTNELTPEQVATLKTYRILDNLRTDAILTVAKTNQTPHEEIVKQVFNDPEDLDSLEQIVCLIGLIEDLYDFLGLAEQFKEDKWSTILRGLMCSIRQDFTNPWYTEWNGYFSNWKTIADVVKGVLGFNDMEVESLFRSIKNVDRVWLTKYMAETEYIRYQGLVGNAQALTKLS